MRVELDDVVWHRLADEVVILNLATGTYFGLNGVGSRIWCLIAEHGSTEKILEALKTEYDATEEQLRQDLARLIDELKEKRLVRTNAQETAPTG